MTDHADLIGISPAAQTGGGVSPAPISRTTKTVLVQKLLSRNKGATLEEIMAATSWQPHSARAFLTGLRKKGLTLLKEARASGETYWRIER